jgi:hypothetical protein
VKTITEHEIRNHGVEHSQYFQGAGTAFTRFDACYTGIGDSLGEALDDAVEQLAMSDEYDPKSLPDGWDESMLADKVDRITPIIESNCECEGCARNAETGAINCTHDCRCFEESELHCFVTLYVK